MSSGPREVAFETASKGRDRVLDGESYDKLNTLIRKIRSETIEEEYSRTYITHSKILSNSVVMSLPDILNNQFHNADTL